MPAKRILQNKIGYLVNRPVRRPPHEVRRYFAHGRYVTFQMAEVAVARQMFADILSEIAGLPAPPAPA